jgi:hypothetical protein
LEVVDLWFGGSAAACVAYATKPDTAVALALVVLWAKAAPIGERLVPLPRGRVEVAVDPLAAAEKATEAVPGSVFIGVHPGG